MSLNRALLWCLLSWFLVFAFDFLSAGQSGSPVPAAVSRDADAEQEILKINADCNAAELRGDIKVMDDCETSDFTHTHASGKVEPKAEYLKGIESGAHKFLALDLSDVHVRYYGAAAIVDAHLHLKANNNGHIADVSDLLTTVWVRQQGKWREAAWMARRVAAESTLPENK
jgi:ketosteroid isomerase-like protein